jgi:hypothetical protein
MRTARRIRIAMILAAASCVGSSPAFAQPAAGKGSTVYFAAGWKLTSRQPAFKPNDPPAPRSLVHTGTFTVGFPVARAVALEASIDFQAGQSFPWSYRYLFDTNTEERATERDVVVVSSVRFLPGCFHRFCVEPVAGGGFSVHLAESRTTADCGYGITKPCVIVMEREPSRETNGYEPVLAGGLDFRIPVRSRLSIMPGFRLVYAWRRWWLFTYEYRGPWHASGLMANFGLTVAWSSR